MGYLISYFIIGVIVFIWMLADTFSRTKCLIIEDIGSMLLFSVLWPFPVGVVILLWLNELLDYLHPRLGTFWMAAMQYKIYCKKDK